MSDIDEVISSYVLKIIRQEQSLFYISSLQGSHNKRCVTNSYGVNQQCN